MDDDNVGVKEWTMPGFVGSAGRRTGTSGDAEPQDPGKICKRFAPIYQWPKTDPGFQVWREGLLEVHDHHVDSKAVGRLRRGG